MTRRSTSFLIHPEAHLVFRPSDLDDQDAPWELLFANGPCYSDEPEHQAVAIALSPSTATGDPAGDSSLGVEYLRWAADNLAGALQRNLILPEEGDYILPNGIKTMMTQDMKDRYGWYADRPSAKPRPIPEGTVPNPRKDDAMPENLPTLVSSTLARKGLSAIRALDTEHPDSPYHPQHRHEE